jgi:hypothetical protein
MSLSVPAQAASTLIASVKTITGGTLIDSLLAKFLNLTHPAGVQREVRHNTVHHSARNVRVTTWSTVQHLM